MYVINPKRNQLRYQLGNPRERLMFIDYIEEGLVSITVHQWHGRGDQKEEGGQREGETGRKRHCKE